MRKPLACLGLFLSAAAWANDAAVCPPEGACPAGGAVAALAGYTLQYPHSKAGFGTVVLSFGPAGALNASNARSSAAGSWSVQGGAIRALYGDPAWRPMVLRLVRSDTGLTAQLNEQPPVAAYLAVTDAVLEPAQAREGQVLTAPQIERLFRGQAFTSTVTSRGATTRRAKFKFDPDGVVNVSMTDYGDHGQWTVREVGHRLCFEGLHATTGCSAVAVRGGKLVIFRGESTWWRQE